MTAYEFYFQNGMCLKGTCDTVTASDRCVKPSYLLESKTEGNLLVFIDECVAYRFKEIEKPEFKVVKGD